MELTPVRLNNNNKKTAGSGATTPETGREYNPSLIKELSFLLVHFNNIIVLTNEDSKQSSSIAFSHCLMKFFKVLFIVLKQLHRKLFQLLDPSLYLTPSDSIAEESQNVSSKFFASISMNRSTSAENQPVPPKKSNHPMKTEEKYFHQYIQYASELLDLIPILLQNLSFVKMNCREESIQYHLILLQFYEFFQFFYEFLLQCEVVFTSKNYKKIFKLFQNKILAYYLSLLPHSIQEILSEMKKMEQFYLIKNSAGGLINGKNVSPPNFPQLSQQMPQRKINPQDSSYYRDDLKLSGLIQYLLNKEKEDKKSEMSFHSKDAKEDKHNNAISYQPPMEFLLSFRFRHLLHCLNKLLYIYQPIPFFAPQSSQSLPSALNPLSFSNTLLTVQRLVHSFSSLIMFFHAYFFPLSF
jgi:hypothetical protein